MLPFNILIYMLGFKDIIIYITQYSHPVVVVDVMHIWRSFLHGPSFLSHKGILGQFALLRKEDPAPCILRGGESSAQYLICRGFMPKTHFLFNNYKPSKLMLKSLSIKINFRLLSTLPIKGFYSVGEPLLSLPLIFINPSIAYTVL